MASSRFVCPGPPRERPGPRDILDYRCNNPPERHRPVTLAHRTTAQSARRAARFAGLAVGVTAALAATAGAVSWLNVWQAESFGDRRLAAPRPDECAVVRRVAADFVSDLRAGLRHAAGAPDRGLELLAFAWRPRPCGGRLARLPGPRPLCPPPPPAAPGLRGPRPRALRLAAAHAARPGPADPPLGHLLRPPVRQPRRGGPRLGRLHDVGGDPTARGRHPRPVQLDRDRAPQAPTSPDRAGSAVGDRSPRLASTPAVERGVEG